MSGPWLAPRVIAGPERDARPDNGVSGSINSPLARTPRGRLFGHLRRDYHPAMIVAATDAELRGAWVPDLEGSP